ncbi:MAG: hypothetical protein J6Z49_02175 [Kiritimatiellae bacterium]|nr:hypothetical protein [Kiritimatiellia bacterium]
MNDTKRAFLLETLPRLGGLALLAALLTAAARGTGIAASAEGLFIAGAVSLFMASLVFFRLAAFPAAAGCALLLLVLDPSPLLLAGPGILLFLAGTMVVTAALKDLGVMTCLVQFVINRCGVNGVALCLLLAGVSAVSAALFGGWFSVFVMCALVFQVCDALKLKPAPFVTIAAVATNLGACMTLSGSPLSLFLGVAANESYAAFLLRAAPPALALTAAATFTLIGVFHRDIRLLGRRLREQRERNRGLGPCMHLSCRRGVSLFLAFFALLLFHAPLAALLARCTGTEVNPAVLLMLLPALFAVGILFARPKRMDAYLREGVDWKLILLVASLSVIWATLRAKGIRLVSLSPNNGAASFFAGLLAAPFMGDLASGTLLSGFLPAAAAPCYPLLFGCAVGANLFATASQVNLAAVRLLEEHTHRKTAWQSWVKAGTAVTVVCTLVYLLLFA